MKASFIFATLLAVASITGFAMYMKSEQAGSRMLSNQNLATSAFTAWKMKHGKSYGTQTEHNYRAQIFADNLKKVNANNNSKSTYKLAMNKFADLHVSEFAAQFAKGVKRNFKKSANVTKFATDNLAARVNWVEQGGVADVKDQGQCGSCWAFSAISSTETANWKANNKLVTFSEQQLVDCAGGQYGNQGCNGGLMDSAFDYIKDNGIDTDSNYPYTARDGSCAPTGRHGSVTSYTDVESGSVSQLKAALNQQTVSVAIEADSYVFQLYSGGILDSTSCGRQLDHGVTVVGYDSQGGEEYFLVRNSWGADWGEAGYLKIAASNSDICGILDEPSFPTA